MLPPFSRRVRSLGFSIGFYLLLLIACLEMACSPAATEPSIGFYYWKTTFRLSEAERSYLKEAGVSKLYLKYADIGLDPTTQTVEPFSILQIEDTAGIGSIELIPCVFIVNEVFLKLTPEATTALADSLAQLVHSYPFPIQELQLDCDWTPSCRASYFAFLRELPPRFPGIRLSATIRLHQYKFPEETGVPPVDRGALMCYNTGQLEKMGETNSILSPQSAAKYLVPPRSYPLPLDPILPTFNWALAFRSNQFWKIIPEPDEKSLQDPLYFRPEGNWFTVQQPLFWAGQYLNSEDRLRLESSSIGLLRQVSPLLRTTWTAESRVLSFYHLNPATVDAFPPDSLRRLLDDLTAWEKK